MLFDEVVNSTEVSSISDIGSGDDVASSVELTVLFTTPKLVELAWVLLVVISLTGSASSSRIGSEGGYWFPVEFI